jgi:hypothetical protein
MIKLLAHYIVDIYRLFYEKKIKLFDVMLGGEHKATTASSK